MTICQQSLENHLKAAVLTLEDEDEICAVRIMHQTHGWGGVCEISEDGT